MLSYNIEGSEISETSLIERDQNIKIRDQKFQTINYNTEGSEISDTLLIERYQDI